MILLLSMTLFFDDIESKLYLKEFKLTNEEMLSILFEEIKLIKIKGLPKIDKNENNEANNKEIINKLTEKIEQLESKIKLLTDENKKIKDNFKKYTDFLDERMKEIEKDKEIEEKKKEENEKFIKQNINVEFKNNPQDLQMRNSY